MSPTRTSSAGSPAASIAKVAAARGATGKIVEVQQPTPVLTDDRIPGVTIALEWITPELAEHYLSKRPTATSEVKQRNISDTLVDRYAEDMRHEQWPFTGDPVRFSSLGELFDGQHRLKSVTQSGTAEMMIVIRGLLPDTFAVFDTGRARSFVDVLTSMGITNVAMAAGVTRRVFYWMRGNYGVANIGRVPNPPFLGVSASPSMLLETFKTFKTEIQAAGRRGGAFKAQFAPKTAAPAVVGFVYMVLSRIDLDRAELFFHELEKGPAQVGPEYPIAVLRKRLNAHLSPAESAAPDWVWIHFFFRTWNEWYAANSMGALRTPPKAAYGHVAKPIDPHAADRPQGWEPLGGVTA
jgi:hypothetical protein